MEMQFTVGKHPNSSLRSSVYKWAVFNDGLLFEGFVSKHSAIEACAAYNSEPSYTHAQALDILNHAISYLHPAWCGNENREAEHILWRAYYDLFDRTTGVTAVRSYRRSR